MQGFVDGLIESGLLNLVRSEGGGKGGALLWSGRRWRPLSLLVSG